MDSRKGLTAIPCFPYQQPPWATWRNATATLPVFFSAMESGSVTMSCKTRSGPISYPLSHYHPHLPPKATVGSPCSSIAELLEEGPGLLEAVNALTPSHHHSGHHSASTSLRRNSCWPWQTTWSTPTSATSNSTNMSSHPRYCNVGCKKPPLIFPFPAMQVPFS